MKVWVVRQSGGGEVEDDITLYHLRERAFSAFRRLVIQMFCNGDDDIAATSCYVAEADALPYEGGLVSNGDIHIEIEEKEVR